MKWILMMVAVGCGGGAASVVDAPAPADAPRDVTVQPIDAPADAARMVRVFGNVDYNGPLPEVTVVTLGTDPQNTRTDADGNFYFDVPQGSPAIMEVLPPLGSGLIPMIRGVVAEDHLRPREFYLLGPTDVAAADGVGKVYGPTNAIIETDFRNAAIGGYGVTLTDSGGQPEVAEFGLVYDSNGEPQIAHQTVTGGDGTTLLLAGVRPGEASFDPVVPAVAALPCHTDGDAQPLPLLAGVATWFDFECGNATD